VTPEQLDRWKRAAATLAEEQAEHDAEFAERRKRRAELERAISARRAVLRAGRRAEREKSDALRESVAKFVEKQMLKAEDGSNASK
jgi:hypothetical protein